jgi:hypothetical protein
MVYFEKLGNSKEKASKRTKILLTARPLTRNRAEATAFWRSISGESRGESLSPRHPRMSAASRPGREGNELMKLSGTENSASGPECRVSLVKREDKEIQLKTSALKLNITAQTIGTRRFKVMVKRKIVSSQ